MKKNISKYRGGKMKFIIVIILFLLSSLNYANQLTTPRSDKEIEDSLTYLIFKNYTLINPQMRNDNTSHTVSFLNQKKCQFSNGSTFTMIAFKFYSHYIIEYHPNNYSKIADQCNKGYYLIPENKLDKVMLNAIPKIDSSLNEERYKNIRILGTNLSETPLFFNANSYYTYFSLGTNKCKLTKGGLLQKIGVSKKNGYLVKYLSVNDNNSNQCKSETYFFISEEKFNNLSNNPGLYNTMYGSETNEANKLLSKKSQQEFESKLIKYTTQSLANALQETNTVQTLPDIH